MERFVAILREQIPLVAPAQTKYRVTGIPSERTIRFYTGIGLVDKPVLAGSGRARYGYRHLLQVMAVKYLQSQYLPLVKIKSLIEDISNRDLELVIPEISTVNVDHRSIAREGRPAVDNSLFQQPFVFDTGRPREPEPEVAVDAAAIEDTWRRIEVGPGIELHVHAAALSGQDIEQVRGALLRELGVLRGWFGGEKR